MTPCVNAACCDGVILSLVANDTSVHGDIEIRWNKKICFFLRDRLARFGARAETSFVSISMVEWLPASASTLASTDSAYDTTVALFLSLCARSARSASASLGRLLRTINLLVEHLINYIKACNPVACHRLKKSYMLGILHDHFCISRP